MLKRTALFSALAFATGSVALPVFSTPAYAAIPASVEAREALVKQRIEQIHSANKQSLKYFGNTHLKFDMELRNYQSSGSQASYQEVMRFTLPNGKTAELIFNHKADFSDAASNDKVLAKIEGKAEPASVVKTLEALINDATAFDADDKEVVEMLSQYAHIEAQLLDDNRFESTLVIEPFNFKTDTNIRFDGLKLKQVAHDQEVAKGYADIELSVGQLKVEEGEEKLILKPFNAHFSYKSNNTLDYHSTPIQIEKDHTRLEIGEAKGKGKHIVFHDDVSSFTGEIKLDIDGVTLDSKPLFKKIELNTESTRKKDLFDTAAEIEAFLNPATLSELTSGASEQIKPEKITYKIALNNLSAKSLQAYNQLTMLVQQSAMNETSQDKAIEAQVGVIYDEALKHASEFKLVFEGKTGVGKASIHADIEAKKTGKLSFAQLRDMDFSDNPSKAADALNDTFAIDFKVNIPESIANPLGLGMFLMYTDGIFQQKNGAYQLELNNKTGKLLLNGGPLPF